MNEEMKINEEFEVMEDNNVDTYEDDFEEPSGGFVKKLVVGTVGVASAACGALLYKNKEKITEWRDERKIKKLEKKGYIVSMPEDFEVIDESEDQEELTDE